MEANVVIWAMLIGIAILVIGLGIWYSKKYGLQLYYWFSDARSKLPPKRHFRVRELGETEDEENAIPIARVPTEYVTKYSNRLAAEAQRIIDEAQESAEESAQEKVLLAEQQAQDIIEAAQVIKTIAGEEANRIVAEAEQKSMEIIEEARRKAEADASSMIAEPRTIWVWDRKQQAWVETVEKAGVQPQCIKEEAEQLLLASKRLGEE